MAYKTNFINFVLNEGIMPSVLTRAIRSDADMGQDYQMIAAILDARCAFEPSDTNTSEGLQNIVKHLQDQIFESDPDLTRWLADVSVLLKLIKQDQIYAGIDIPVQQKQWAVSAFIKSCPLLTDTVKQQYLTSQPVADDVVPYQQIYRTYTKNFETCARIPDAQAEFVNYITRHEGKAAITANAYRSALNSIKKKYNVDFWAMTGISQIDNTINRLMDSDSFMDNNANTHGAWVAAMRKYRAFRWFEQYTSVKPE